MVSTTQVITSFIGNAQRFTSIELEVTTFKASISSRIPTSERGREPTWPRFHLRVENQPGQQYRPRKKSNEENVEEKVGKR
jgi:hypothetical protein